MDFKTAFKTKDRLLTEWSRVADTVHSFLTAENRVKDKDAKALIRILGNGDIKWSDSKLLHCLMCFTLHVFFCR